MTILNFPANPENGDVYTVNGINYTYNNGAWSSNSEATGDARYVLVTGDNMSGSLTLGGGSDNGGLNLNTNGSAVLAGGNLEITSAGQVSTRSVLSSTRTESTNLTYRAALQGSDGTVVTNIFFTADGKGEFRGDILSGNTPVAGANPGTLISHTGGIIITAPAISNNAATNALSVFEDGVSLATVTINVDGNANFAGTVRSNGNVLTLSTGELDVGDKLSKAVTALTAIKAAVSDDDTDLVGMKSAIKTALANF